MVTINEDGDYIEHYGTPRHSGRYPYGSGGEDDGERPFQGSPFLKEVDDLKAKGLSEPDIAKGLGMSTTQLRAKKSIAKNEEKQAKIQMAQRLKEKGYSTLAISKRMGIPEPTARSLLAPGAKEKADFLLQTSEMLKTEVADNKYIDVGTGVETHLGISQQKLNNAVEVLKAQGYEVHPVNIRQLGTGLDTRMKVLAAPGTTQKEVFLNRYNIKQIRSFTDNGGHEWSDPKYTPLSISPKRVKIRYGEEGGANTDGVIYVRPGVEDISLGKSRYAQVRVQVGSGHYLKGMAMYKDDLPDGVDLVFNTNKNKKDIGDSPLAAMKKLERTPDGKVDPDLPFGSLTRPLLKETGKLREDGQPEKRVSSVMNIVNEEGDWSNWSRNISAQALSKQPPKLAKAQLDMTYESRKAEYDEIMSLTNPTVRKKLLKSFADGTDASSVHLKAAALERQNWQVILPIDSIKPTEIYAPNYRDGERVALIRYPHGGTFEIPELTVNNRHPESKKLLGQAKDAVGIHHTVAERLSGADFDGDTVLVIPNDRGKIISTSALKQLEGFDPKKQYPKYEGMPKLTPDAKQKLMGDISNLITDMTIKGAPHSEIAKAVKHSMVVIDAEKHELNYKQSAIDHGIAALKREYQRDPAHPRGGAATLISRAGSPEHVPHRIERPQRHGGPINPVTGAKEWEYTGRTRTNSNGQVVDKTIRSKKLAETDDAHSLVSDVRTPVELLYADHSNKLKALANQARLDLINTPRLEYSPSANKAYAKQVESLDAKLTLAVMNSPRERQAQVLGGALAKARTVDRPDLDREQLKKIRQQSLETARARLNAKKQLIDITPDEWDAIQAGAISNHKLEKILTSTDIELVRTLATPRPERMMTRSKTARAQVMLASGYTRAEVASQLGVSIATLDASTTGDAEDDDE